MIQRINKTLDEIRNYYQAVVLRASCLVPLLLFSYIGFGFSLYNRTVSVDDLARELYFGSGNEKLAGFRWGQYLIIKLFSGVHYSPFVEKFVGLLFLILASTIFSAILYYLDKESKAKLKYTVFSCLFVTFPLINEIWEYNESCIPIGLAYVITSFCLLYQLTDEKTDVRSILFVGSLMSIVAAGVESVLVSYVMFELIILYLKLLDDPETNWFMEGLRAAFPLAVAVVIRTIIGVTIINVMRLSYTHNGASGVYWFKLGLKETVLRILANYDFYLHSARHYMPITEFGMAVLAFSAINICYAFRKKFILLPIGVFIMVSIFSISLIQGQILPLRVAHICSLFVAFTAYLLIRITEEKQLYKLNLFLVAVFLCLSYRQSIYLHDLLALNNQRSENEAALIRTIGYRLHSEFDFEKPVVFCGNYDLGTTIKDQIKNKTETNVQSVINWATVAFDNQNMMKELFSYYGYDINVLEHPFERMNIGEYNKIARDSGMKPLEIRDFGPYILVYFGS